MKNWVITANDPGAYTIASDARCISTSYTNDQIWELTLDRGDPPAVAVETTFGLRVRNLRIFPRFIEHETAVINPNDYAKVPIIERVYPNYLALTFEPFDGLKVYIEYWIPESQVITGRTRILNQRLRERKICLEWAVRLTVNEYDQRMMPKNMHTSTVLSSQLEGLAPTFFQTGGAIFGSGPYPSLAVDFILPPGGERIISWALASKETSDASFEHARKTVARAWDAEIARLDILNNGLIAIETGNPDWNIAFSLAQKSALSLLLGPSDNLNYTSFILNRQPDQGFSNSKNGADYPQTWSGQTALETLFLASYLLPSHPELVKGFLLNFLSSQTEDGSIDWRPGLGGQRTGILATPVLTRLAWEIYQVTEDQIFLKDIYPKLVDFIKAWFSPIHDRDGDGIPEWGHALQAGFDEHPLFSAWHTEAQNVDIQVSESPALCAFLYSEIKALISIARILMDEKHIVYLQHYADKLHQAVELSWHEDQARYQYWDRDTHLSHPGELLGERKGPGEIYLKRKFDVPVRLVISIQGSKKRSRQTSIFIHGINAKGQHRVERIAQEQSQWQLEFSSVTSQQTYLQLDYIDITNIDSTDIVQVQIINFQHPDITLLLPLWAKIPVQERAACLVEKTICNTNIFWQPFGLPFCPPNGKQNSDSSFARVSILWNNLIGEGLLAYGFQKETSELINHLMKAVTKNLKEHKCFLSRHHAKTGQGVGERHAIQCLAPLGLFLKTLGVRPLSATKVALHGNNPFPWPVTVRYRGLTITKDARKTKVTFPGGQTAVVKGPKPHLITLDENKSS